MYKITILFLSFLFIQTGLSAQSTIERNRLTAQEEPSLNFVEHLEEWSLRLAEAIELKDLSSSKAITGRILKDLHAYATESSDLSSDLQNEMKVLKTKLELYWVEKKSYPAGLRLLKTFVIEHK